MRTVLSLLVLSVASSGPAQEAPAPEEWTTRIEAFAARREVVLLRGSTRVGSVQGPSGGAVSVEAREYREAAGGARAAGLVVEVRAGEERSRCWVDLDEVPALLDGIDVVTKAEKAPSPLERVEASYCTRDDLCVRRLVDARMEAFVSGGTEDPVVATLRQGDIDDFRGLVEKARDLLR